MTRITNTEHVLLLLKERLQRAQRQARAAGPRASKKEAGADPIQRARRVAANTDLSPAESARVILAGLLAAHFGDELANDPKFQQLVEDVRLAIERDPTARELLKGALAQVTQS